jgi:hypothetical protein
MFSRNCRVDPGSVATNVGRAILFLLYALRERREGQRRGGRTRRGKRKKNLYFGEQCVLILEGGNL